ncbi:MAG: sialate O-acetylesterase, partial [Thermoguttaceae bacterium]|nr:sialate O-acetylesterase [Thermoguttaceae bacterium]
NGKLERFAVQKADGTWVWGSAVITGPDTGEVTAEGVDAPAAVRYAWQMNPTGANLYSAEGLPATPFRTDK